jgi:hypothetical protein
VDTIKRHGKGAVFFACEISKGIGQTLPNRTNSGRDIILKLTLGPYIYIYIYTLITTLSAFADFITENVLLIVSRNLSFS